MYTVQGTNPRSLSLKTPCKFAATRFDGTFFQYKHQNRWVYPSMAENLNMSLSSQNRQFQEFQPPPFLNIPGDKTVLLLDRASRKLVSLDQWHRWLDLSWTLMCHWVTLESSSFCTTVRCKEARCQLRPSFYLFFLVGCACGNIEELKHIFGLDFIRETKSLGVLQRLPAGILKASVLCDSHTLKGGHSVGSPIFWDTSHVSMR